MLQEMENLVQTALNNTIHGIFWLIESESLDIEWVPDRRGSVTQSYQEPSSTLLLCSPSPSFFLYSFPPCTTPLKVFLLGNAETSADLGWLKKHNIEKNGLARGLGVGKRMLLDKSVQYLEVLKTRHNPESRCLLGKGAPLGACESLAVMLSLKAMRVPAVTGESEQQGWTTGREGPNPEGI